MPDSVEFEESSECSIISNHDISFFTCGNKGSVAYIGLDGDWVIVHAVGGHGKETRRVRLNPPCECKFGVFSADDESLLLLVDKNDAMRVFDLGTGKVDSVEPPKGIAGDDQTNGDGQQQFVSEFDTVTSATAISDKSNSRFLISTCNSLIDLYVSSSEKCKTHKTGGFGFDIIKVLSPCIGENGQLLLLASYEGRYIGLGEIDGTFHPLIESSDSEILDAQMSRSGEFLAISIMSTNRQEVICWDVQAVIMETKTKLDDLMRCAGSGLRLQGLDGPSRVCWCSSGKHLITFDGDECALWDVSDCTEILSHVRDKSDAMILSGMDGQILGACSHPSLDIVGILRTTMLGLYKNDSFRKGGVQAPFASIGVPIRNPGNPGIYWNLDGQIIIKDDNQMLSVDVRSKIEAPVSTNAISQLAMHLIPMKNDKDAIVTPCKETENVHQAAMKVKDDEPSGNQLSPLRGLKSKLGKIRTRPKSPKDQEQRQRYMGSSSVRTPKKPAFQPPLYNYYSSPTYVAIDSARMVPGPCSPPMGYFAMSPDGHYTWAGYPGSQVYYAHPHTLPVWYSDCGGGAPGIKAERSQRSMQQEGRCGTPHHPAAHGYSMMPSGQAYGPFIGSSSTSSGTHSSLSGEYEIFRMSMDQPSGSATQLVLPSSESDQMHRQRKSLESTSQRLQSAASSHHPSEATVYIGNLPNGFQEDSIAYMCSPWGSIFDIQIIRDKVTKISRGYAFVTFLHPEEAQLAIQNLNGQVLQGPYGQTHMLRVGPSNRKFTCQAMRDVVREETNQLNRSR